MANNELKWSADEIADACVKAGLGVLEANSLMVTLKAMPTPAQAEPSGALPENWEARLQLCPSEDEMIQAMQEEITELRAYAKQAIEARGALSDADIERIWKEHTVPVFGMNGINANVFARAIEARILGQQGGVSDAALLDFIEKNGFSVVCNWMNTGFCGPEGHEWQAYIYGVGGTRDSYGKTVRAAIAAAFQAQAGDAREGGCETAAPAAPIAEVTGVLPPPPNPDSDPFDRLAEFIHVSDDILLLVAELRSKLYVHAGRRVADPMEVIDAARRARLDRRLRNDPIDWDDRRVSGFDRRARVAPFKP